MDTQTLNSYDELISSFRQQEYPMLKDSVYMDHAGSTIPSKSLMDAFAHEITSILYGNPHSGSGSSQLSTSRIEDIRLRLLGFFKADPAEYDLVFVANATAGVKLVIEGFRTLPQGFHYAHHEACHTSLVGAREEANQSQCLDDDGVREWLSGIDPFNTSDDTPSATLFSYSAQSHLDGKRYPLSWAESLRTKLGASAPIFTLLDAASYSATSQLDLSHPEFAADFTVLSLYKIFGFPDLGALIVRRSGEPIFDHRKYFGGGTVDMVVCGKEKWHASKSQFLHERLEDGTLPFHSIMAVDIAMTTHRKLYGSMDQISVHTSYLAKKLVNGLKALRHHNGQPVCAIYTDYSDQESRGTGPVVSFNVMASNMEWISLAEFEKLAMLKKIHIRTGSLCSPGGIASTLDLEPWELRRNFSAGIRCGNDSDIMSGKPAGVIRASIGAMSRSGDVQNFVDFVREFFTEASSQELALDTLEDLAPTAQLGLRVKAITVFPIKSCGGLVVPAGTQWELRPEGLAWDREWCLVHRGSGQALSQKRYPKMALLRPLLNFEKGLLRVEYHDDEASGNLAVVEIPLSTDPSQFDLDYRQAAPRVCGEQISAHTYLSDKINDFFTDALGVSCVLARFPPGGRGLSSRLSKARMQKHQRTTEFCQLPGSFPGIPSPPDSDSEQQRRGKILLSNESPILMIHSASVDALNHEIQKRSGGTVSETSFRANIILESAAGGSHPPYSEETWKSIRIGREEFTLLGACRRCQMVCVDQDTGKRRQEPFVTLAKTRRFDGKVYFGSHMRHDPGPGAGSEAAHVPMIGIGDAVLVDAQDGV